MIKNNQILAKIIIMRNLHGGHYKKGLLALYSHVMWKKAGLTITVSLRSFSAIVQPL